MDKVEELTGQDNAHLDNVPMVELKMRLQLVTTVLLEARESGDARYERLIPQQRKLNDALVARLKVERGEIAPTKINMKSVVLTTTARGV